MTTDLPVLLSPSKVSDLATYFRDYPRYPLRTDVLLDLMLYPKVILAQTGLGTVWSLREVESRRWKKYFEDLINLGAAEVVNWYLSKKQEVALLTHHHSLPPNEAGADLAFFYLFSYQHDCPLLYRPAELQVFEQSARWIEAASTQTEPAIIEPTSEVPNNASLYNVARLVLDIEIPSVFGREPPWTALEATTNPDEFVWIDPVELVRILTDRVALAQLREYLVELSGRAHTRLEVNRDVLSKRRDVAKSKKIGDIGVNALGVIVELAAAPFIHVLSPVIGKFAELIGKPIADRAAARPYRWLLMTEDIERRVAAGE